MVQAAAASAQLRIDQQNARRIRSNTALELPGQINRPQPTQPSNLNREIDDYDPSSLVKGGTTNPNDFNPGESAIDYRAARIQRNERNASWRKQQIAQATAAASRKFQEEMWGFVVNIISFLLTTVGYTGTDLGSSWIATAPRTAVQAWRTIIPQKNANPKTEMWLNILAPKAQIQTINGISTSFNLFYVSFGIVIAILVLLVFFAVAAVAISYIVELQSAAESVAAIYSPTLYLLYKAYQSVQ
jgi:hypothetical protein